MPPSHSSSSEYPIAASSLAWASCFLLMIFLVALFLKLDRLVFIGESRLILDFQSLLAVFIGILIVAKSSIQHSSNSPRSAPNP